jgi:hypothetical protein
MKFLGIFSNRKAESVDAIPSLQVSAGFDWDDSKPVVPVTTKDVAEGKKFPRNF